MRVFPQVLLTALLAGASHTISYTAASSPDTFRVPVEFFTLDNGLKVVVSEERSSPVVLVEVMYGIGFRSEPKGRTGFAHLFEHLMFQGSGQVKKMEHDNLLLQVGGTANGSTRLDYTNYFQALTSNGLELTLWLEADRMRSLDFTEQNLRNQVDVVKEEVRVNVLNQPHAAFEWLEMWQRANVRWANAHNFYGDFTELEAATLNDARTFFKTYYAPNNAVLVVVGDADASEVRRLAQKHFGDIPRQPSVVRPDVLEPPQVQERRFTRHDQLARTPAVALAWHLPSRMTKDFFALSVLDPLLVGNESSKLYQRLVRTDRHAASVSGAFNIMGSNWDVNGPLLYIVRADYLNDKTAQQVLDSIEAVLADIRINGLNATELEQAKTVLRSRFHDEMEGGTVPYYGRANLLAALALFDNDPGRINTLLPEVEKITAEDVKAAVQRWFVRTNQTSIDSRPATP